MKILIGLLFLSFPVLADSPVKTLILPTELVGDIEKYLYQRPYAEVALILQQLQACASIQLPNSQGQIVDKGQCPSVSSEIHAKQK